MRYAIFVLTLGLVASVARAEQASLLDIQHKRQAALACWDSIESKVEALKKYESELPQDSSASDDQRRKRIMTGVVWRSLAHRCDAMEIVVTLAEQKELKLENESSLARSLCDWFLEHVKENRVNHLFLAAEVGLSESRFEYYERMRVDTERLLSRSCQ